MADTRNRNDPQKVCEKESENSCGSWNHSEAPQKGQLICKSISRLRGGWGWAGAPLPQNHKQHLQTDMNSQLAARRPLLQPADSVWGAAKGRACAAVNFLRQAAIAERLYLGRITSPAQSNLTFGPRGSRTAALANDSVTVGLRPRWNRLKRTKHVPALERCAARQI